MAGFRILDPFPQYANAQGVPLAGGELRFYATGTTTAKNVYGNKALTVNNGSIVVLDSSGRTNVDVWGDGTAYRVRLYTGPSPTGTLVDEADDVEIPGGIATALPSPALDGFLVGNGSIFVTSTIRQVPDMTGQSGKVLGNNGTTAIWQPAASTVTDSVLTNVRETQQTVTAAAATTINFALGAVVKLTQAADITALTLSGAAIAGQACTLTIFRVKDNTATARAITWPASVVWLSGTPILPQTANAVTAFTLMTFDAGVTWYGSHSA